ncbi:hypothetical protein [Myxococcus sp. AS-1-15]|uniref:hypothetical protein n=1 Tax=Myxococcus sp. AS-1-15 TaxID=2874600 RepID=UPI001CBC1A04|nr:hypothetical protein [Myxococcus sp. AS-1-15]MBZ4398656.1 hypothetical protein [Myxococcus sp. AS-1-15]
MSCVGELADCCARLRTLRKWWRPEEVDVIAACIEEAEQLPEREATEREALRVAEDELRELVPNGTDATQSRWRELQRRVTAARKSLNDLAVASSALYAALGVELWWARTNHWREGVENANAHGR